MVHHLTGHLISDKEGHNWEKLQILVATLFHVTRFFSVLNLISTMCLLKQLKNRFLGFDIELCICECSGTGFQIPDNKERKPKQERRQMCFVFFFFFWQ